MLLRIGFAILATILLLPCLGFGVIGYFHASGESNDPFWIYGYLALDIILLGAIVAAWLGPFLWFKPREPGCCEECGQDLGPEPAPRCPECGRPNAD